MAANIGDIRLGVESRVQDDAARLGDTVLVGDVDRAILAALAEYQIGRPRLRAAKVAGTGAFDYQLDGVSPALPGWVQDFSDLGGVLYPYDQTKQRPTSLDRSEFVVLVLDTGIFLRFLDQIPAAGSFFLAQYTTPHSLSASTSTVSPQDDDALEDLAASFCFGKLAAVYAQDTDASYQADSVNRPTKSDLYRKLAADLRKAYDQKMQSGAAATPASRVGQIRRGFGNRGNLDLHFLERLH